MLINPKGKLLAVLDHAEEYRLLAIRSRDRGERERYERIRRRAPPTDCGT